MAPLFKLMALLSLATYVSAQGKLIPSPCAADAECDQGCCGFNTGKCAGPVIAKERDGGCGFGSGTPNFKPAEDFLAGQAGAAGAAPAAPAPAAPAPAAPAPADPAAAGNAAGAKAAVAGDGAAGGGAPSGGNKFITADCQNDSECALGCCSKDTKKCAARLVAEEGAGCGFVGGAARFKF